MLRQCTERKQQFHRAILRFSDECRVGGKHSREVFQNVLHDIDEYLEICERTGDRNGGGIEEAVALLKETERECLRNNTYVG